MSTKERRREISQFTPLGDLASSGTPLVSGSYTILSHLEFGSSVTHSLCMVKMKAKTDRKKSPILKATLIELGVTDYIELI